MARAGEGWSIGVTCEKQSRAVVMANASFSRRLIRGTPSSLVLGTASYRPSRTILELPSRLTTCSHGRRMMRALPFEGAFASWSG